MDLIIASQPACAVVPHISASLRSCSSMSASVGAFLPRAVLGPASELEPAEGAADILPEVVTG